MPTMPRLSWSLRIFSKVPCFQQGSLQVTSYARPGKLFTASGDLVERVAGLLHPESLREVIAAVVTILGGSTDPAERVL